MNALAVLELLNIALKIAETAGVNYNKLVQARQKAALEGREISADELKALAADSQQAIDALKNA